MIEHVFASVVAQRFSALPDDPADDGWRTAGAETEPAPLGEDELLDLACAPWASLAEMGTALPGGDLASVLEIADPAGLDDTVLVEAIAAAEKLAAWAHQRACLLAAELSRRGSMNPDWDLPLPARTCVAGDELAMRLGWSKRAANRLVRDGRALEAELAPLAEAVAAGLVDIPKLHVLTDRLAGRAYQLTWPVLDQVLPRTALRTPTQLAADVDRALLTLEPEDAAVRLPRAVASRHVCHPRRLPDGMAGIWAVLPAADAARVDGTLDATARTACAAGDPRTLDQLRADTLTALAAGDALLAGAAAAQPATGGCQSESERSAGPRGERDWRVREVSDGAADEHETNEGEGSERIDGEGASSQPRAPRIRVPKVRIDVTVALSTLLGMDEKPAELAGLGPIPAEQARALAMGGTWRRIVTDPLTGAVLDVGRDRYRPPAALVAHVTARDGCCAGPGCSVPADRCDIDHTTEFHGTPANGSPLPGTTSADNLGPLSERCHRLKTDGGFTLRQVEPGVFEWRTPAGLGYRVTPGDHGRTELLDPPRSGGGGYPDEPPF